MRSSTLISAFGSACFAWAKRIGALLVITAQRAIARRKGLDRRLMLTSEGIWSSGGSADPWSVRTGYGPPRPPGGIVSELAPSGLVGSEVVTRIEVAERKPG